MVGLAIPFEPRDTSRDLVDGVSEPSGVCFASKSMCLVDARTRIVLVDPVALCAASVLVQQCV